MKIIARITLIFLFILLWACSGESDEERSIWPNSGGFTEADVFDDTEGVGEEGVPAQIEFPRESLILELDQTFRPEAIVRDGRGEILEDYPVNWTSRNESILKISSGGVAVALGLGKTTLLAEAGDVRAMLAVEVIGAKVGSIRLYPQNRELRIGESVQYIVEARSETNAIIEGIALGEVFWAVADESVARINSTGITQGLSVGVTEVIATVQGLEARAELRVSLEPVGAIYISPDPIPTLSAGDTLRLQTTLYDLEGEIVDGRNVQWDSSSEAVATIDIAGMITAHSPGVAQITASIDDISWSGTVEVEFAINRVAAGEGFGCAVAGSKLYCWDAQGAKEVFSGPVRDISLAESRGCVVTGDRQVYCFEKGVWEFEEVNSLIGANTISVGESHICAIDWSGKLFCWGDNSSGQLGRGGASSPSPVAVNSNQEFVSVAAGGRHTCAADINGDAWCWGANDRGQLGGSTQPMTATPSKVEGGYNLRQLTAGTDFTCGTHPGGPPLCWGAGDQGQLGNGTTQDRDIPTFVSAHYNIIQARGTQACGLLASGEPRCWGAGLITPTSLSFLHTFMEIDVGRVHVCGRSAGHQVSCWMPLMGITSLEVIDLLD